MPYFVSWHKDGRVRPFAYPHTNLETAMGFANEVLKTESTDVWICDEKGDFWRAGRHLSAAPPASDLFS
jgi:hypothetical protein